MMFNGRQENSTKKVVNLCSEHWSKSSAPNNDKAYSRKENCHVCIRNCNIFNCNCSNCKSVKKKSARAKEKNGRSAVQSARPASLEVGDRVLVKSLLPGVIRYVGNLDRPYADDTMFIGIKLDDPKGEHDGVVNGKRFFTCPPLHGVVVPHQHVELVYRNVKSRSGIKMPSIKQNSSNAAQQTLVRPLSARIRKPIPKITLQLCSDQGHTSLSDVTLPPTPMASKYSYCSTVSTTSTNPKSGVIFPDSGTKLSSTESGSSVDVASHVAQFASTTKGTSLTTFPSLLDEKRHRLAHSSSNTLSSSDGAQSNTLPKLKCNCGITRRPKTAKPGDGAFNKGSIHKSWLESVQRMKQSESIPKIYTYTKNPKEGIRRQQIEDIIDDEVHIPLSVRTIVDNTEMFDHLVKQWGGGIRGWTMAKTFERVREATRLANQGKQVKWEDKVRNMSQGSTATAHLINGALERIKDMKRRIKLVREERASYERMIRENKHHPHTGVQKSIAEMRQRIEISRAECQQAKEGIKGSLKATDDQVASLLQHYLELLHVDVSELDANN